jgi:hypothetical protein
MKKFYNLTSHPITIQKPNGEVKEIPPFGIVARMSYNERVDEVIEDTPIMVKEDITFSNLPHPQAGVYFIVSQFIFNEAEKKLDRNDLLCPDTGQSAVRDEKGEIINITRLIRSDKNGKTISKI